MAELTQLLCGAVNLFETDEHGLEVLRPHTLQLSAGVCAHTSGEVWEERTGHLAGLKYLGLLGEDWPMHTWSVGSLHDGGNPYLPPPEPQMRTRVEKPPGPCESPFCPACRGAIVQPWRNVRTWPEDETGLPPHPAPERPSTAPEPEGVRYPSAVLKVAQRADAAGWRTRLQSARGWAQHAGTGKPTSIKDTFAIRFLLGDRAAFAVHDGKSWVSVQLRGPDQPSVSVKITALTTWLAEHGRPAS